MLVYEPKFPLELLKSKLLLSGVEADTEEQQLPGVDYVYKPTQLCHRGRKVGDNPEDVPTWKTLHEREEVLVEEWLASCEVDE